MNNDEKEAGTVWATFASATGHKEPRFDMAIYFKGNITELGLWFEYLPRETQIRIYNYTTAGDSK